MAIKYECDRCKRLTDATGLDGLPPEWNTFTVYGRGPTTLCPACVQTWKELARGFMQYVKASR